MGAGYRATRGGGCVLAIIERGRVGSFRRTMKPMSARPRVLLNSNWNYKTIAKRILLLALIVTTRTALAMNEYVQAMECDDCSGGSSSDTALVALFGFLLILGGSSWWALNVLVREARFWPFAATVGTFAWFLLEGGRNKFPVLGWLLVGLVAATFYFLMSDKSKSNSNQAPKPLPSAKTITKKATPISAPDHTAKCNNCGASLLATEHGLCVECRIPDRSIAPGIAEHVAKTNIANLDRIAIETARSSDLGGTAATGLVGACNYLPPTEATALEPPTDPLASAMASDTDAATLEALSQHIYPAVRQSVAGNVNCPQFLILKLRKDDHPEVRFAAASNGAIAPSELAVFSQDEWPDTRRFVADHALTPVRVLETLAGDGDIGVRLRVAKHKKVARTALDLLACDEDSQVRLAVAKHKNASDESLSILRHDSDFDVRLVLAKRTHGAKDGLEALANSHSWQHRLQAASNPLCPTYLLEKLAADPEPEVGKVAKKRIARARVPPPNTGQT